MNLHIQLSRFDILCVLCFSSYRKMLDVHFQGSFFATAILESNCDIVEDRKKQKQWARIFIGSSNFKLSKDTNYWGY